MKKTIFFLLFIIIISAFLFFNSNKLTVHDISNITITHNEEIILIDKLDFSIFIDSINTAEKTDTTFKYADATIFNVNLNLYNEETRQYSLGIDKISKKTFLNIDENYYILNSKYNDFFFLEKYFEFIYDKTYPEFTLFYDEAIKINYSNKEVLVTYEKINKKLFNEKYTDTSNSTLFITNENNLYFNFYGHVDLKVMDSENNEVYNEINISKENLYIPKNDGNYNYIFSCTWDNINTGKAIYTYNVTVNAPPYFEINKTEFKQGEILTITAFNLEDNEIPFLNTKLYSKFEFFKYNNSAIGHIPITAKVKIGEYSLKYGIEDQITISEKINVIDGEFKIQNLYIKESIMSSTSSDTAYSEANYYFSKARENPSNIKLYDKDFILPINGRLSTEFGERRFINDSPTSYNHSGLDIAANKGTPISSSNDGIIKMSRFLALTGNTIVIDHGEGLFSYYLHMSKFNVEEQQLVNQGDIIGFVGTTGRSTGNHLHFGIGFYNFYIDPSYLIYGQKITKENYLELME